MHCFQRRLSDAAGGRNELRFETGMNRDAPTIVDAHVHLWNPERFRYAWLDDLPVLNRPMQPSELTTAIGSADVRKLIFVECGCDASQNLAETDWIAELAETEPRLRGIIAHAPLELGKAARADLEALARRPLVKGVRRNLQSETGEFLKRPEFMEGLKLLPEFGFTFDLCIRADQLTPAGRTCARRAQVTFVLDHFGKPAVRDKSFEPWARDSRRSPCCPMLSAKFPALPPKPNWTGWQCEDLSLISTTRSPASVRLVYVWQRLAGGDARDDLRALD